MVTTDLQITVEEAQPLEITVEESVNFEIYLEAGVSSNFVLSDTKFLFDGATGNTYFLYNSNTNRLELWVNGSKVKEWS